MIEVTRRTLLPFLAAPCFMATQAQTYAATSAVSNVVTPRMYGAIADGIQNDTSALQATFDAARTNGYIVDLEGLAYATGPLTLSAGPSGSQWTSMNEIRGGQAILIANQKSSGALVTCQNVADRVFSHISINGNGLVQTCLDTSWTIFEAPSQNNLYDTINLRGALGTQWIADSNNDSVFQNIVIQGKNGNGVALQLLAPGGHVRLVHPVIFNGIVLVQSQTLTVIDGIDSGYKAGGNEANAWTFLSGSHYTDASSNLILNCPSGLQLTGLNAIGGQWELDYNNSCFMGGQGNLTGGAIVEGCHIIIPNGSSGTRLLDPNLVSGNREIQARYFLEGDLMVG